MRVYGSGAEADHATVRCGAFFFDFERCCRSSLIAQLLRLLHPVFTNDPAVEVEHVVDPLQVGLGEGRNLGECGDAEPIQTLARPVA
jgi:hypothetical protein